MQCLIEELQSQVLPSPVPHRSEGEKRTSCCLPRKSTVIHNLAGIKFCVSLTKIFKEKNLSKF